MMAALRWYALALVLALAGIGTFLLGAITFGSTCAFAAVLAWLCGLDEREIQQLEAEYSERNGEGS